MTFYSEERASAIASELAVELDTNLQVAISHAGWSNNAHIESDKGVLKLSYNEEHESNLFESEYGRQGQSPNSVIRPFLTNSEPYIKNTIEADVVDLLFSKGILP